MKDIKETLSKIITSKPEVIQFTKDRKFENAWITPLSMPRPSSEEINKYLMRERFETLIVEYIWNQDDDDNRFVLTIFLDSKCLLHDPSKFIEISLDNFYQYSNFKTLLNNFDNLVIGHQYLFKYQPEAVNISIFNHWLSVGPIDLWKAGEMYDKKVIDDKINSRAEILKSKLNYQGLFFRFNVNGRQDGPYYGIKTPCCNKKGDGWSVDFQKIDYWIKAMI